MGHDIRVRVRDAYHQIKTAERMFDQGLKAVSRALNTVGNCEDILLENGLENLPQSDLPITEHRRLHRMGRAPKIDSDPELQAFILARIDRMTYAQLAADVATHFPEPRRIGKSAIHAWATKQAKR